MWNPCTFMYKCVFHVHFIRTVRGTRKVHEIFRVLNVYGSCWHEIIRFVYVFQNWYTKPKQFGFGFRIQYTKTRKYTTRKYTTRTVCQVYWAGVDLYGVSLHVGIRYRCMPTMRCIIPQTYKQSFCKYSLTGEIKCTQLYSPLLQPTNRDRWLGEIYGAGCVHQWLKVTDQWLYITDVPSIIPFPIIPLPH